MNSDNDTGISIISDKPPISSGLIEEPSEFELFEAFGEESEKFETPSMFLSYLASSNLPYKVTSDIFNNISKNYSLVISFHDAIHKLRYLIKGYKFTGKVVNEIFMLPISELHRPKINGCKAEYTQTYETEDDYSISLKIFGVGFGTNATQKLGFSNKIEITKECIKLVVPAEIEWKECEFTRGKYQGEKFFQSKVKEIGKKFKPIVLETYKDYCNMDYNRIQLAKWRKEEFPVPDGATNTVSLSLEKGTTSESNVQTTITGIEVGPKIVVKYLRKIEQSYSLIGKYEYVAYYPQNSLSYYWRLK